MERFPGTFKIKLARKPCPWMGPKSTRFVLESHKLSVFFLFSSLASVHDLAH